MRIHALAAAPRIDRVPRRSRCGCREGFRTHAGIGDGYVEDAKDCGDTNPLVFPGSTAAAASALEDTDCDGFIEGNSADADVRILDELDRSIAWVGASFDGSDDLLISSHRSDSSGEDAGTAYLFLGSSLATQAGDVPVATADYRFLGAEAGDALGRALTGPGDMDGDSQADLAFGAAQVNRDETASGGSFTLQAGAAYVVRGASVTARSTATRSILEADATVFGDGVQTLLGWHIRPAGDVDGDGRADLLVGGLHHDSDPSSSGVVALFLSGM